MSMTSTKDRKNVDIGDMSYSNKLVAKLKVGIVIMKARSIEYETL